MFLHFIPPWWSRKGPVSCDTNTRIYPNHTILLHLATPPPCKVYRAPIKGNRPPAHFRKPASPAQRAPFPTRKRTSVNSAKTDLYKFYPHIFSFNSFIICNFAPEFIGCSTRLGNAKTLACARPTDKPPRPKCLSLKDLSAKPDTTKPA